MPCDAIHVNQFAQSTNRRQLGAGRSAQCRHADPACRSSTQPVAVSCWSPRYPPSTKTPRPGSHGGARIIPEWRGASSATFRSETSRTWFALYLVAPSPPPITSHAGSAQVRRATVYAFDAKASRQRFTDPLRRHAIRQRYAREAAAQDVVGEGVHVAQRAFDGW